MRSHGLKFIDLFCGIGGFHYAFQSAGAHCVWASDYDKNARETYLANHKMEPWGDIWASKFIPEGHDKPLEPNQIPHHDILCAGFPCQPFSIAGVSKKLSLGRKHGFEDEKQGNLFFRLAAIIGHYKPKAFVLENVKNLRSHDKGNTFLVIYNTLRSMGYHLHTQIVDARHYVPQHRERIFIVGFLEPLPFEFPTPGPAHAMREARLPVLGDILEDNPKDCTLSDNLWNYLQAYAKKHQAAGNGFGCDLVGPDAVARTLSARYYKDGSEILIRQKGKNPRKLSIDECRKLMGYPEGFKPAKSKTQAYKQFGNSVVVPVVESIAHQVVKTLKTYEMVDGEARKR
jgi:DNA (cytosine-5)-methyltransferase 1